MNLKNILLAIGCVGVLLIVVKMSFIGYYPKDLPFLLGIGIVSSVCLYIYTKIANKEARDKA